MTRLLLVVLAAGGLAAIAWLWLASDREGMDDPPDAATGTWDPRLADLLERCDER
jgi:hypothetical protein